MSLTPRVIGSLYEKHVLSHIINNLGHEAYLWPDCPRDILLKYGIIGQHNKHRNILRDTGIDIIEIDKNNKCGIIQCKNGYKNGLGIGHLNGFALWMASLPEANAYVYYTSKLSYNLKELPPINRLKYVNLPCTFEKVLKT